MTYFTYPHSSSLIAAHHRANYSLHLYSYNLLPVMGVVFGILMMMALIYSMIGEVTSQRVLDTVHTVLGTKHGCLFDCFFKVAIFMLSDWVLPRVNSRF